jgi:hypothetical protein
LAIDPLRRGSRVTSGASYVNNRFTFRSTLDIGLVMSKNESDRAIAKIHAVRGLPVRIADACDVSRQCVHQWTRVPSQHVLTVAAITKLAPATIRPDVFRRRKAR